MTNDFDNRRVRQIVKRFKSQPVLEGAGVRLRRAFGKPELPMFDPFLLLDDFGSDNPEDYMAGFPWHPHRGIKTVTYMLAGEVEHRDSLGNQGVISSGGIQWMTAGSGIIHQEMPRRSVEPTRGFQLWINLSLKNKMTDPAYQDLLKDDIPLIDSGDGVKTKLVSGELDNISGPVLDTETGVEYFDILLPPNITCRRKVKPEHNCFAYVFNGRACFGGSGDEIAGDGDLLLFGKGSEVEVQACSEGARFILVSGKPLGEAVAWGGPIVMNTEKELDIAMEEYRNGTFIKKAK